MIFNARDLLTANSDTLASYLRMLPAIPDAAVLSWKRKLERHISDTSDAELRKLAHSLQVIVRFAIREAQKAGVKL